MTRKVKVNVVVKSYLRRTRTKKGTKRRVIHRHLRLVSKNFGSDAKPFRERYPQQKLEITPTPKAFEWIAEQQFKRGEITSQQLDEIKRRSRASE